MQRTKEEPQPWSVKLPGYARISTKERISFFKYLGIMIQAGVPLEKGLVAVHEQARSSYMHRALHLMLRDVESGEFLSTSLRKMPQLFDRLMTQLVAVGEQSGTLAKSMIQISEYLEKSQEVRGKINAAMLYPLIVVAGTIGITVYMLFVLLPQLEPLFNSLHVPLPWTTRFALWMSHFLIRDGLFVIVVGILLVVALFVLRRAKRTRYSFDAFLLRLPVFGTLIRKNQITQFSRIIFTLLSSGIVVVEAFRIASDALSNEVYKKALQEISESLQNGQSISSYLAKTKRLFPPFVSQMVTVGEETGSLQDSFSYLAAFSDREVDDAAKNLTTILEPLLIVFIGFLVGFIAISIITPIYQLTQGIHG